MPSMIAGICIYHPLLLSSQLYACRSAPMKSTSSVDIQIRGKIGCLRDNLWQFHMSLLNSITWIVRIKQNDWLYQVLMVNSCYICLVALDFSLSKDRLQARSMESMMRMEKAICVVKLSSTMSLLGLSLSSSMKSTVLMPRVRMFTLRISSQRTNSGLEVQRQLLSRISVAVWKKSARTSESASREDQLSASERLKLKMMMSAATIHSRKERRFTSATSFRISFGIEISLSTSELAQKSAAIISSGRQFSVFSYCGSSTMPSTIFPETKLRICRTTSLFSRTHCIRKASFISR